MTQGRHKSVARMPWTRSSRCHTSPSASCLPVIAWLIIFLLFVLPASAQEKTKDLMEVSLEDLVNVEVYSASKHTENVSDAPSSVTVVSADEIQKHGYRTLADILESVRGFYITYDRDYSFVGVRGFGRLGDSNNRILVLIDGHRINDNVFGEPYLGTEFLADVDLIDHVEVIRGPSSSLYGADALFAMINVITRKGEQMRGFELSFAGASFGTYRGRASYGRRFRGIDMMFSGTFFNSYGPLLFFRSSTALPVTMALRGIPTMKARSTFWGPSAFMVSRCRDYSARATREFRPPITGACSMIPKRRTSIGINIST